MQEFHLLKNFVHRFQVSQLMCPYNQEMDMKKYAYTVAVEHTH